MPRNQSPQVAFARVVERLQEEVIDHLEVGNEDAALDLHAQIGDAIRAHRERRQLARAPLPPHADGSPCNGLCRVDR